MCIRDSAYNEMKKRVYDVYMSYDGTVLTTFLHRDPSEVPAGSTLFDYTNGLFQEQDKLVMVNKLGLDNTYAVAVPKEIQSKYNLKKMCIRDRFVVDGVQLWKDPNLVESFTHFYPVSYTHLDDQKEWPSPATPKGTGAQRCQIIQNPQHFTKCKKQ